MRAEDAKNEKRRAEEAKQKIKKSFEGAKKLLVPKNDVPNTKRDTTLDVVLFLDKPKSPSKDKGVRFDDDCLIM